MTKKQPNLSHLRKFGCKAYPLDKSISRKEKLLPRAHIGFLVGYDGTNIYFIWIPSQRKIIRTRDVIFNEGEFYKQDEIDLAQIIKEPFLYDTLDIQPTDTTHLITELSSDSDEEDYLQDDQSNKQDGQSNEEESH